MSNSKGHIVHKLSKTPLYHVWQTMKQRCANPRCRGYQWYGAKGIKVCKEWNDVRNFYEWAMDNGYEEGLTLDRVDLDDDTIYIGFNSKHYDSYIIKAIVAGLSNQEVKQVNDYIIAGGQGWQCPLLDGIYFRFSNVDIRDDTQQGLSLKAIEGHLSMSVKIQRTV